MKKNGKRILVIDGQGGRLGRCLVESILERYPGCSVMAVGTNSTATAAMVKGGAEQAATGENPVLVACRRADVIVGPIGIVIADALHGEVTPKMAAAVAGAEAVRLLIPVSRCDNIVVGVRELSVAEMIDETLRRMDELLGAPEKN